VEEFENEPDVVKETTNCSIVKWRRVSRQRISKLFAAVPS